MEVDRQIVAGAIANLMQNAFKFTRQGGHVSLRTSVTEDRVLIEVEDQCGGLPPGKAEELFDAFQQRGEDRSGLGLGLFISRKGRRGQRRADRRAGSARAGMHLHHRPAEKHAAAHRLIPSTTRRRPHPAEGHDAVSG